MPIENRMRYQPNVSENDLKGEADIIKMLRDVRTCIAEMDTDFASKRLKDILAVVEKHEYRIPRDSSNNVVAVIDLTFASRVLQTYRFNSEGGCQSCKGFARVKPVQDETFYFCSEKEDGDKMDELWVEKEFVYSPEIRKHIYKSAGCDRRVPVFERKLEEVIEEAENAEAVRA